MRFVGEVLRSLAIALLYVVLAFNLVGFAALGAFLIVGNDVHVRGGWATIIIGIATVVACRWAITRLWPHPRAEAAR